MRPLLLATSCIALVLVAASGCATRSANTRHWLSPLHRNHPLVGRVWDVRTQQFVELGALKARARDAHFVLLGETHDNPDHHLLQAELLRAIASSGRKPAVAFEMLDVAQQPQVDAALIANPHSAEKLAQAVDWAHSEWPAFAIYRPVFEAALELQLPIVAANLSRKQAREVIEQGSSALESAVRDRLSRDEPVPVEVLRPLREEMRGSHCGALPEEMVDPMVMAQRARDVQLALRMEGADRGSGVVLIAGGGHVRNDRGVPFLLARDRPDKTILSIAFLEVQQSENSPTAYARSFGSDALPFDYVVFTPAFDREDPCQAFLRLHPPKSDRR